MNPVEGRQMREMQIGIVVLYCLMLAIISFIDEMEDERANFWLSAILIESDKVTPAKVIEALSEKNIESRPIWKPMHMQPLYMNNEFITSEGRYKNEKSVSEDIFERGLCLPSDNKMTEEQQDMVIAIIRSCFR